MPTPTQRLLKSIGEAGLWKPIGRVHGWIYRSSGGRFGHRTGGLTNLLLTTTGRKSGEPRTVTLTYMPDGDRYVLVASNGGQDRHPDWWLNLTKRPRARVQVGDRSFEVVAAAAQGAERDRLWSHLKTYNPPYAQYEQMTDRKIPVVVLTPAT